MNKYPKIIIECAAHTDSKGPDNYNVWMADRRAKRAVDYIIGLGINSTRITGKGYGATQLVNNCSRDVECTDTQHAKNRRTEFVVIKT
jgi:outer membrane protein OmpA-like peptidoglycan-associated protein